MIVVSFDVAKGRQEDFRNILESLDFKRTVGEGVNVEFLPESTMASIKNVNLANLESELQKYADASKIEIERLVMYGGLPLGIVTMGKKLKTKE